MTGHCLQSYVISISFLEKFYLIHFYFNVNLNIATVLLTFPAGSGKLFSVSEASQWSSQNITENHKVTLKPEPIPLSIGTEEKALPNCPQNAGTNKSRLGHYMLI